MERTYTISAFTENHPGVLHRLTATLTRRKVNIESLTVSETEKKGVSRFTIVVNTSPELISKIVRAINRIIECVDVFVSENQHLVYKEIAFFRVGAQSPERRPQIEELAHRYGASISYAGKDSIIVEKTGSEDEIDSLCMMLEGFELREFVRSGRIAIRKIERNDRSFFVGDE